MSRASTSSEKEKAAGSRDDDIIKYIHLYRALVKGDLGGMKAYLDVHPDAISAKISTLGETPLHIAVSHCHAELVEELLGRMGRIVSSISSIIDEYGDTPLHIAARSASDTTITYALVQHSPSLMALGDADGQLPLTLAAIYYRKRSRRCRWTTPTFSRSNLDILGWGGWIVAQHSRNYYEEKKWTMFTEFIMSEQFGLALGIWNMEKPELMTFKDDDLYRMAEMASVFSTANQFTNFERWLINCINNYNEAIFAPTSSEVIRFLKALMFCVLVALQAIVTKEDISKKKEENMHASELLSHMCSPVWTFDSKHVGVYFEAIKRAIKCGNVEFVEEVLRSNPALLWGNRKSGSIFHIAVAYRQEKIWNLIYGLTSVQRNKILGTLLEKNSILHIAACPMVTSEIIGVPDEASKMLQQGEQPFWKVFSKAPGAAMKVQRELQWYKDVERMVPSSYRILANEKGETPPVLFSKWHSELVKEGEKWLRDTATSCTIVATLIVTVMFAAAFTLPGGTDDESGNPKFLGRNSFMVFIISDALSLFSSATAVLMFLSILTSRFEEKDFLKALPKRLIIGLAALFVSIAAMMVAFGSTLVIVLGERISWAAAPVTLLASVPVTLFALLQFPLFVDMVSSTYGGIFNRKTKCSFFNNPNNYVPGEGRDSFNV
ncbi:uncharacterized protein LOC132274379 isoform X2 [Cornus florida]|uniref:uncharacterized protein LOC132274379 isoform X2 n=1 Tax=Cornus florida TaxID=4283 RepID=UPI0028A2B77D|nr:uncharacterized protein LOC132274379 isoform X2 [Cornus florida]